MPPPAQEVVQLLVSWKAALQIKNRAGHTAADVASLEGQTDVWEYLEAQWDKEAKGSVDL
jgi:hypothetical protein